LSIDLSVRHHIADSVHLLLHLERDRGRRLMNEVVRVRGYDSEQDRYLTETRYQRAGSKSTAARPASAKRPRHVRVSHRFHRRAFEAAS
jgi:hypothetical protein